MRNKEAKVLAASWSSLTSLCLTVHTDLKLHSTHALSFIRSLSWPPLTRLATAPFGPLRLRQDCRPATLSTHTRCSLQMAPGDERCSSCSGARSVHARRILAPILELSHCSENAAGRRARLQVPRSLTRLRRINQSISFFPSRSLPFPSSSTSSPASPTSNLQPHPLQVPSGRLPVSTMASLRSTSLPSNALQASSTPDLQVCPLFLPYDNGNSCPSLYPRGRGGGSANRVRNEFADEFVEE
jgi:hypothetical protein